MKSLLEDIAIIENMQLDTRAECFLMLEAVKKCKRRIENETISNENRHFLSAKEVLFTKWTEYNNGRVAIILDSDFVDNVLVKSITDYHKQFDNK